MLQGQRADKQQQEMKGIEIHYVKNTKDKWKEKRKKEKENSAKVT